MADERTVHVEVGNTVEVEEVDHVLRGDVAIGHRVEIIEGIIQRRENPRVLLGIACYVGLIVVTVGHARIDARAAKDVVIALTVRARDTTGFLYDNSDTSKKFLDNLRADYGKGMREYLYPESLYTPNGIVFGRDIWNTHRYHRGTALNFRLQVKSIANGQCTVRIEM